MMTRMLVVLTSLGLPASVPGSGAPAPREVSPTDALKDTLVSLERRGGSMKPGRHLAIRGACLPGLSTAMVLASTCIPAASRATIHVIAHDYAFTAPEAARPGPTTLTFENRGTAG